jgi:hypothetical protein
VLTAAGNRAILGTLLVLAVGAALLAAATRSGDSDVRPASAQPAPASTSTSAALATTGPATTAPPPTTAPPTALAPEISVPAGAVGAYTVASGQTRVVGGGALVTYTVEVEDAVGYSVEEFARIVDRTLADHRSWTADGSVAFQRVPGGGQVRVVLATPASVDQLCLPLQTNGRYSCHQGGVVALNSERWLHGTEEWPGPLVEFRHYAVNHEMGHAIGHGHTSCGGAGQPAPVMMQQSKGLEGCRPNGWPFP